MFRVYQVFLVFNGIIFNEVWIAPHYELKHLKSIDDELILELLKLINFENLKFSKLANDSFKYYESDIGYECKLYRLIMTVPPDQSYLGIVNAYRRSK